MRLLLIIIAIISFSYNINGQSAKLDLDDIKSFSKTENYSNLLNRYIKNDTTLDLEEYQKIYYGQAFQSNFKPYSRHDSLSVLNQFLNNHPDSIDFNKVIDYNKLILSEYPLSIEQIFMNGVSFDRIGDFDNARIWFHKYGMLMDVIMSSGNGKSYKSAIVVITTSDEYAVLNALELRSTGQSLINKKNKKYDLISVLPNDFGIKVLFFNIDLFFGKY